MDYDFETIFITAISATVLLTVGYIYRNHVKRGIVFTPMVVCSVIFLITVAPPMLLAPYFGIYNSAYPALIFFLAFVSLWIGFLAPRQTFVNIPVIGSGSYTRLIQRHGRMSLEIANYALICLLIMLGLAYYEGLPLTFYSLLATLAGDFGALTRDLQLSRLALTKGAYFGGEYRGQGIFNTIQQIGWAILIAYQSARLAVNRGVKSFGSLFFTVFLAWLFVAGTGARAPFILCLGAGIIAYSMVRPISVRAVLILFGVLIGTLVFLTSYTHRFEDLFVGDAGWADAVERIFSRLFVEGNGSADVMAILAADEGQLTQGVGYFHARDFVSAIPGVHGQLPLAYHLTQVYGGGSTTFLTGTYLSKVYVDFGLPGIVVVFIIIGWFLRILQNLILSVQSNAWSVALASVIALYSSQILTNGFHEFFATLIVFFALIIFHFVFLSVAGILVRAKSSRVKTQSGY